MTPLVVLGGGLLAAAANLAGLWWVTLLAGLAAGAVAGRVRRALALGAAVGLLGWGLPLALAAVRAPLAGPSRALGSFRRAGPSGGSRGRARGRPRRPRRRPCRAGPRAAG